jgi:hypothetical protein
MYRISGVVGGPKKVGMPDDVKVVQEMLTWNHLFAGPINGICDDATVAAVRNFQATFMPKPDGAVSPTGTTFRRLSGQDAPWYRIIYGPTWHEHEDGQSVNWELLQRLRALTVDLIGDDLVTDNIRFNEGVRSRKRAHRMSTSWFLRQPDGPRPSKIPLENLRALPGGKDLDGNQWYDPSWNSLLEVWPPLPPDDPRDITFTDKSAEKVWNLIRQRAYQIEPQNALAAEGYPVTDPRILPNVHPVVSNHVEGNAIDCTIRWKRGAQVWLHLPGGGLYTSSSYIITDGGLNDAGANFAIEQYGLCRPVTGKHAEPWHFQLAKHRRPLSPKYRSP